MSFDLLSEPIRKFIRDKGWEELRPIQTAAIARILASDDNYILASRTASGKTEAAFLPILSKVDFNERGVQVLYVSPLIALINDQFCRVEELCKNLDVDVVKWHGEANKTVKDKLLKNPKGIVLITPESLEAMLANKPFNVRQLFSNLKYVVIDEIHSFIGTDRGIQLKSILSRLQQVNSKSFSIVGLSATIGDYDEAKKFTGDELKTKVLLDRTTKEINVIFKYFKSKNTDLPLELLKDLYIETKDNKVLIFPNSRGRVEEVAVKLRKISVLTKGHSNYFSHHSSVDREVREYVEYFAKNNNRQNFCISCTSTLELGIDIGAVDEVVQIDTTHSIASLIQRVGRSGRNEGNSSNLYLYATNEWSLLQSIACWLLYKEGFIEPPQKIEKPYDILVHQALSITKGYSGIKLTDLIKQLRENSAFKGIELIEIEEILNHSDCP
jgi:ATP-dependent Lhr-like helicase